MTPAATIMNSVRLQLLGYIDRLCVTVSQILPDSRALRVHMEKPGDRFSISTILKLKFVFDMEDSLDGKNICACGRDQR